MSNRRAANRRAARETGRRHPVQIRLRDGTVVRLDLGRRFAPHAWFCAVCGQVDEGQPSPCAHTEGYCIGRVRAAARQAAPGSVLVA